MDYFSADILGADIGDRPSQSVIPIRLLPIRPCAYTPAVACYATMATPPEDDFPTTRTCPTGSGACKCTDEAHTKLIAQIKAERERSGASRPFEDKLRALGKTHTSRRIVRACDGLGPNAMTILAEIAERLQHGRAQYNDDFDKPRDWAQETFEELADGLVYSTQKIVELRQMQAADKARAEAANRGPSTAVPPIDMRHYSVDPRDGAAPTAKPIVEGFHTPAHRCCGCYVCNPPERPDWEKTRDGCG